MRQSVEKDLANKAVEGSFWHVIASVIQKIGGLVFSIIIARALLPEGFGIYSLALSVVAIFFVFAQTGTDRTFIRYISSAFSNKIKERTYFHYISKIKVLLLSISLILIVILAFPLSDFIIKKPVLFFPLLLAAIFTFVLSLEQFFVSYFFAIKRVKFKAYEEIILQVSRIAFVLIAFFTIYPNPTATHALIIIVLATLVPFIYVLYQTHSVAPHLFLKGIRLEKKEKKRILKFLTYISLTSISIVFLMSIDTVMLGLLIPDASFVGLYKSAFIIASSISGLLAFSAVLLPIFVQITRKNLEKALNRVLNYSMILAIPATFGLIALGDFFVTLIFGQEYSGAYLPLTILSFLIVPSIIVGLLIEIFSARERPKDYLGLLYAIMIINIVLNFLLITHLSQYSFSLATAGAATATLVSWVIYALGMGILAKKRLNIKTNLTLLVKPLAASIVMFIVLMILKSGLEGISFIEWIFLVFIGIVIYVIAMIILKGIKKEDYLVLKGTMSHLFSRNK